MIRNQNSIVRGYMCEAGFELCNSVFPAGISLFASDDSDIPSSAKAIAASIVMARP